MESSIRPYEKVASSLKSRIAAGEWHPGELIPARRVLATEYGVAAATLERAAGMLIAEGILSASDRRGTFVAGRPPAANPGNGESNTAATRKDTLHATIGIMAEVIPYESPETRTGQWPAQMLAACEHGLASEQGLTQRFINLVPAMGTSITPAQAAMQLIEAPVDALVVIGCLDVDGVLALTEAAGIPLVCAAYDPVNAPVPQVCIDSEAGGALAARHLRERGYRRLTYLRPFTSVWAEARLAGAQGAAGPDGLRCFPIGTPPPVSEGAVARNQTAAGYDTGHAFLQDGFETGTGIIAPNDAVALGFMRSASERGLEAGRDYGLIGFDDSGREAHLTSLRPPLGLLGNEAASLVMRLLRGEPAPVRIGLQHRLIARASTTPFAGADRAASTERRAS